MNAPRRDPSPARRAFCNLLALVLLATVRLEAQDPMLLDSVPKNNAGNVSLTAPIVFTFSKPMNTDLTEATFAVFSFPLPTILTDISSSWNAAGDVLTCTPTKPLQASTTIIWVISGEDPDGNLLAGTTQGQFTTGTGGGGGGTGTGTNHFTIFSLTRAYSFSQTTAGAPVPDVDAPYFFSANLTLASNRTAFSADVQFPTPPGTLASLTRSPIAAEDFYYVNSTTSQAAFDAAYPPGNYLFKIQSDTPLSIGVTMPSGGIPNAPHVVNFTPLQSANPGQPITLQWDPFTGGTAADAIQVSIGTATNSPDPGEPGALKGTATSWSIPAGTLQPNTTYDASITFLRANSATNAAQLYVTLAARGAYTTFPLTTGSGTGPTGPIELGAASVLPGSKVAFSVTAPAHQSLIIESKDALAPGNWTPLLTTDNPTGTVRYTNTIPNGVNTRFYRARSGP